MTLDAPTVATVIAVVVGMTLVLVTIRDLTINSTLLDLVEGQFHVFAYLPAYDYMLWHPACWHLWTEKQWYNWLAKLGEMHGFTVIREGHPNP